MPDLSVRLLGVPEIKLNGSTVQLNRRHSLALLAYLLLTQRPHSREELAELLSGDSSEDAARKRLRNALADLTSNNLADFLLVTRQAVEIRQTASIDIDIWKMDEMLVPDARPTAGALDWVAERCDLELLSGISLQDAPEFELWLVAERESRHQQLIRLTFQQLQQMLWSGQVEAGINLSRRLLTVEPWHEGAHRILMQLLARNDQLAAALTQYERCREILHEELGVEPQPETLDLYEKLRRGPVTLRNNLTVSENELNSLLGRESEVETVVRSLTDPSCRLFTIAGMGGAGKTSLALAVASHLATPAPVTVDHPFADGIIVVDLASTLDGNSHATATTATNDELVTAIGLALGLVFYGRVERLEQVIAHLEPKRLLLILDNIEHYLEATGALQAIVQRAPQVTVLVTSHTALKISEEWTLWLGGLSLPESPENLEESGAAQLFLRESRRVNARIEAHQQPHIVGICRQVGGLPLALKVVAAWTAVMTCAEIEQELESTGVLLRVPPPNARADGASIQAVVAATCESLPDEDQHTLRRLAVFPSQFSATAAAAIGVNVESLLTLSQRLLVENLMHNRFVLHPLIRQRALATLAEDPDEEAEVRDRHATYFAAFVAEQAPRLSRDPGARGVIEAERSNIRAAWTRAVDSRNVRLVAQMLEGLAIWNELAGIHREWGDDLTAATATLRAGSDDLEHGDLFVRLLIADAEALLWQGELERAFPRIAEARRIARVHDSIELEALISACEGRLMRFRGGQPVAAVEALQQARILARAAGQPRVEANSILQLSFAAVDNENYREAESFLIRAEEAFQTLGDRLALCRVIQNRGRVNALLGDYVQAAIHLEQSLHMARQFGNRFVEGFSQLFLGIVSDSGYGQHREAEEHFNRTREIVRLTGDPYLVGNLQRAVGRNALHAGDFALASQSFEYALKLARDVNNFRAINESLRCLAQLACESGDLDAAVNLAQQAQRLSSDQGRRHAAASAQLIGGLARERLGQLAEAEKDYAQAYSTADELAIPYLTCDAATGIAAVALARGDVERALTYVEEVLGHLHESSLAGCEEPGRTIWTCYDVLRTAGDRRAEGVLATGVGLLERRLIALPQTERRRYLWSYADRVGVLRAWAGGQRAANAIEAPEFQFSQILQSILIHNALQEESVDGSTVFPARQG